MLFPIRIDDRVLASTEPWASKLRDNRHIGDFTGWKAHDSYTAALEGLLHDLTPKTDILPNTPKHPLTGILGPGNGL